MKWATMNFLLVAVWSISCFEVEWTRVLVEHHVDSVK